METTEHFEVNPMASSLFRQSSASTTINPVDRLESTLSQQNRGPINTDIQVNKLTARRNAAKTSDLEYQNLLQERAKLLDKKFLNSITKAESARLAYVRWSLDRIEDARNGYILDAMEEAVARYEGALREIQGLHSALRAHTSSHPGKSRGR